MSDTTTTDSSLFEEFPPISTEEWEEVIRRDLNGANYKEKLRWDTGEGITPLPFYRREDLATIERDRAIAAHPDTEPNSWEICVPIFSGSITSANEAARKALNQGGDGLKFSLRIERTEGALGGDLLGLPIQNQQNFTDLLQDIPLANTPLHFDTGPASPALLAMLINEVERQELPPHKVKATFSYDPFRYLLERGHYPKDREQLKTEIYHLASYCSQNMRLVQPLCIDACFYHNTGATIVEELGYGLAAASEYLALLTETGLDAGNAADRLHFNLSVGSSYFLEIAKFRALRVLWQNLLEAYNVDASQHPAHLHGETSRWNKTLFDPYTNMLRTSTEGMSAAIAGCDSLTILPFDQHYRQPDEFSQRIARNQQLILREESHLDKVTDPSAGSYYIEKLTDQIGQKAWQVFQEIEQQGGLLQAIEDGTIQTSIRKTQQKRDLDIASRGRIFVGTNQYSNAEEQMTEKIEDDHHTVSLQTSDDNFEISADQLTGDLANAFSQGAQLGDLVTALLDFGKQEFESISPYRGTIPFEELRLATEQHEQTPEILTLPIGNKKWRKGRSTFSANFFGCAGYHIEEPIGFEDIDAAVATVKEQQPDIVVLCSSDNEYNELVPAICSAFEKLDQRPILVLAGYPKEQIDEFKEAGIDEFIHTKCNVLATLKRFQNKLKIIEN